LSGRNGLRYRISSPCQNIFSPTGMVTPQGTFHERGAHRARDSYRSPQSTTNANAARTTAAPAPRLAPRAKAAASLELIFSQHFSVCCRSFVILSYRLFAFASASATKSRRCASADDARLRPCLELPRLRSRRCQCLERCSKPVQNPFLAEDGCLENLWWRRPRRGAGRGPGEGRSARERTTTRPQTSDGRGGAVVGSSASRTVQKVAACWHPVHSSRSRASSTRFCRIRSTEIKGRRIR
jgi:hypothetical protein